MIELTSYLQETIHRLFGLGVDIELTRPDEKFGDYSTNVALQVSKQLGKNPHEVAQLIVDEMNGISFLSETPQIAGPGFINFTINNELLAEQLDGCLESSRMFEGQTIVVEYSDPNPFKVLHIGHLYTSVVGDGIANLLEHSGASVKRVNFGGDVGLHVAKTIWAISKELGGLHPDKLEAVTDRPQWMADNYVRGNNAYEDDPSAKTEITEINKSIYSIQASKEDQSDLAKIYWTTRAWSYEYFDEFYAKVGTKFDKYYPESETVQPGLELVKSNIGKVFEQSDGAIVFKGEAHNLHTRVFINSEGLPTYETKDVGLALLKTKDYNYDRSVIITGNDQYDYMQVVLKALEQINPDLAERTLHITHGIVKLPGSEKMSSRKGNIIRAEEVIEMAYAANKQSNDSDNYDIALGAVKYAFIKQRIGADIIFDPKESVALDGNSGPYLQYAHARALSILEKSGKQPVDIKTVTFDQEERKLARKISLYQEAVAKATMELMPHHICTYLYELAQSFNRFYENSRIIDDPREEQRLALVTCYAQVLENGLKLLNIEAVERV